MYKSVAATVLALSANAITPPKYTYDLEKPGLLGGSWTTQSSVLVWQGKWGNWENLKACPQNYYVCGLQTRMEKDQGFYSDDTALNGMKMQCCQKSSTTSKTNVTISEGYYRNLCDQGFLLYNFLVYNLDHNCVCDTMSSFNFSAFIC